jgi:hypothetical protein
MYIVYCLYYYETDLKDFIVLHRLLSLSLVLRVSFYQLRAIHALIVKHLKGKTRRFYFRPL